MAPAISVHVDSDHDDTEQYIDVLQRGFEISEGKLRFNGRPFLYNVPSNVRLSPNLSVYLRSSSFGSGGGGSCPSGLKSNSAFLGFDAEAPASRHVAPLGKLRGVRFTSLFRFKVWWTTLWVGDRGSDVQEETQFLLLDTKSRAAADGCPGYPYVLLLPVVCEGGFRASLQGGSGGDDSLAVCVESGSESARRASFRGCLYLHAGHDPYLLVKDAVRALRAHLGTFRCLEEKCPPRILDKFGWCTWDAFYLRVSPRGIWDGVNALALAGVPPRFLIIDDGWQSIAPDDQDPSSSDVTAHTIAGDQMRCRLTSVKENKKFKEYPASSLLTNKSTRPSTGQAQPKPREHKHHPNGYNHHNNHHYHHHHLNNHHYYYIDTNSHHHLYFENDDDEYLDTSTQGLGAFIHDLKSEFELLEDVYVWHALAGYWGGVRPGMHDSFKARLVKPTLSPGASSTMEDLAVDKLISNTIGLVPPSYIHKFYDKFHAYLSKNGVTGVKVDVMQVMEMLGEDFGGRVSLAKAYYDALSSSIRKNFEGNGAIASMEHCNDFMLLGTEQISMGRVGDDFWCADANGDPFWLQGLHMVHCAYNSLWMGQFIQPDWDMFQSKHVSAPFHAAARAISGGPIYVSDKPGEHDIGVLKRLVLQDGSILRCESFALPTIDCLFHDPSKDGETVLKLWNVNKCGGVIGVFNCQGGGWSKEEKRTKRMDESRVACEAVVRAGDIAAWNELGPPFGHNQGACHAFVVLCHNSGHVAILRGIQSTIHVSLEPLEFDIYTVVPLTRVRVRVASSSSSPSTSIDVEFAALGLSGMFNGGGAVQRVKLLQSSCSFKEGGQEINELVQVDVRGSGQLVAYASLSPKGICLDGGAPIDFDFNPSNGVILLDIPWTPPMGLSTLIFNFS